jgi:methionyl-tRNA synthetase
MSSPHGPLTDVASVLERLKRPKRAIVTAGMPYVNGPLHLGHLAGAQLPADIMTRFLGLMIGRENVLFVNGSDEHGSTSEVSALQAGIPIREFVDAGHARHRRTIERYSIGLDVFTGTSQPECFAIHRRECDDFIRKLNANGLLEKRKSRQWYDPKMQRFLPDRFVRGTCPNPRCRNPDAYSDECERCGHQYDPSEIQDPRSNISDAQPVLKETVHWWLDMWAVAEPLRIWLETREKTWRKAVMAEVYDRVRPSLRFEKSFEERYAEIDANLPKHKKKYTPNKQIVLQFGTRAELESARFVLTGAGIDNHLLDEWAHRSISRDISWGVPLPDIDPELAGKTLYVWPDSLIAPISFSQVALIAQGKDPALAHSEFWRSPDTKIAQFLGQDNVYFYTLMQGAMWLGTQRDPQAQPAAGDLQMTDIYACFHLLVGGEKMSKSTGNFYTGDQLLDEKGYAPDQIRYYLALLGLGEKSSDFDFQKLDERNKFLAGPMNAAFERPVSAAHSKFGGKVPEGVLLDKAVSQTVRLVQHYLRAMDRADYPNLLFEIENYARIVNSLFSQFKPHDDRHPLESRSNALYTSFYVLKNLMIMLYPFVPTTMDRLRETLRLPPEVFRLDELGKPIPAGHELGQNQKYFPGDSRALSDEPPLSGPISGPIL